MNDKPSSSLPESARVVVVGGGIVGCSVAYHLTARGWRDVCVLEQGRLGGGTTWHAAGLVGRLRTSRSMTRINQASAALYARLHDETGVDVGWNQVGSLMVAQTEARMTQFRRTAAMAELFGVEAFVLSAREAGEHWPQMRWDDLVGAVWLPGDGKVEPGQVPLALAAGAQQRGATVVEGVQVTGFLKDERRICGVKTDQGEVQAEHVVLCGGMWTRSLGLQVGVALPVYPVEHHYVVTEPIDGVSDSQPVARDPDATLYFRSKGSSIVLGAFQAVTKPWDVNPIPADFSFQLLEPDWDKFEPALAAGRERLPVLRDVGYEKFVNGPESFTPDNQFLLGQPAGLEGLWVAAGFNSAGIACAGGAGEALAAWMIDGDPGQDLWSVDVRRFGRYHNDREFLRKRVTEVLGLHYAMAWPNREMETARGVLRGPLHDRLGERGACFGQKMGWERPNWFAPRGIAPEVEYAFGRQNWFEHSAAEVNATRNAVAIFDQSSFAKLEVVGRQASQALQWLCGNDVDTDVGRVVYTGWFNQRGTFESDLTVVRRAEHAYLVITGTAQRVRDLDWLERQVPEELDACTRDVTEEYGVLGVMGPQSRDLLASLTSADLSNEAFPFATAQQITLAGHPVLALRMTYVGELGYEVHIPTGSIGAVYDALIRAGEAFGLRDAGHAAIQSMRLEKAYRAWGAELSIDDSPLQAGLGFALAWDKPGGFLGRDALLRQKGVGVQRRLVSLVLEDAEPVLWGGEPILRDGAAVGYTTSAAYGHTLGASVGLGYVRRTDGGVADRAFLLDGKYEIDLAGERLPARVSLAPPYDPRRERILC